jgi:hypothetical protein
MLRPREVQDERCATLTEGEPPSAPNSPSDARRDTDPGRLGSAKGLRGKWRELSFEKQLSILLAPLLVALVSGLIIPRVNELFTKEAKPSLEVVDLVVHNRVAKYRFLESQGDVQTKDSVPIIEVILHNTGNRRSVVTRAAFTIQNLVNIEPCTTPTSGLNISSSYDIELPTRSRIGQTIEVPISQQLGADEADRFIFRLGSPIHYYFPDDSRGAFVYRLAVSLSHDNEKDPLNVGTVVISVPGLPGALWTKALASSNSILDPPIKSCLQSNTAAVRTVLAQSGERSSELKELSARLS